MQGGETHERSRVGVVPHRDNNPQRARTRPLDAASKERGAQQQRPTTNAAGSARRGRHPEFIENRKLNSRRLEGRGHPPPRGGARVSLVDPRRNRRATHRKSITEQRKNFPASPSIKIAILLLGIASEIASEEGPYRFMFRRELSPNISVFLLS